MKTDELKNALRIGFKRRSRLRIKNKNSSITACFEYGEDNKNITLVVTSTPSQVSVAHTLNRKDALKLADFLNNYFYKDRC